MSDFTLGVWATLCIWGAHLAWNWLDAKIAAATEAGEATYAAAGMKWLVVICAAVAVATCVSLAY